MHNLVALGRCIETLPLTVFEHAYRILNMGSTRTDGDSVPSRDDRTTKARIRDAAIDCFAEHGIAATTARKVATAAGVSPGLVIHHFVSMDGLRSACDEYVVGIIRRQKSEAMAGGPSLDVLAALRESEFDSLLGYLARVLVEDTDTVANLVDDLVRDAEDYIQNGVDTGMLRPTSDPHSRAVILMMWSLGALVLHRHVERLIGVDLTNPDFDADPAATSYVASVFDIYGGGILTDTFAASARRSLSDIDANDPQPAEQQRGGQSSPPHFEPEGNT
jgi:AcrR family transcriptional regulator